MALWSWRTLPDERVEVDRGSGYAVPYSGGESGPVHAAVRSVQNRVLQWRELADKYGAKYNVPPSWILGVIQAESGGDPHAENWCCAGLMAIYYSVHGKTREQMLDPEQNVDYGTSLLARSRNQGWDLPAAASMHVAGASSDAQGNLTPHGGGCRSAREPGHPDYPGGSPWGYCEHMLPKTDAGDHAVGYIDRVVRAHNSYAYYLQHGRFPDQSQPSPTPGPTPAPERASFLGRATPFVLGAAAGYYLTHWTLPKL